jgi:FkbM family methyltransferase
VPPTGSTARPPLRPREGFGADGLLILAKNVLFHAACLRDERRYLAVKGRLMLLAARLGAYEHASMALLPAFVRRGATAVDAGAHLGAYTHALARLVGPAGRVFSFEPVPRVAAFLERSCRRLPQVTVIREALSDTAGEIALEIPLLRGGVPEPALAAVHRADRPRQRSSKTVRARARRLDDHFDRLQDVCFIKADLEGHEAAFLTGAARTISTFRPVVQFEAAGLHGRGAATLAWAGRAGYRLFQLRGGRLAPAAADAVRSLNAYLVPEETVTALPAAAVERETASR